MYLWAEVGGLWLRLWGEGDLFLKNVLLRAVLFRLPLRILYEAFAFRTDWESSVTFFKESMRLEGLLSMRIIFADFCWIWDLISSTEGSVLSLGLL